MDPLSTLCTSCGLCCDGSLFTQVPLSADEVALLRRRGLPLLVNGERRALTQRCAALAGSSCTIYEERPEGCRRYRCMLHAALAGDVTVLPALPELKVAVPTEAAFMQVETAGGQLSVDSAAPAIYPLSLIHI